MPGRETEKDVVEVLQSHGYETYRPPKAKYREQDVFGLYDIMAFGNDQLLAIQVKGGVEAAGITEWMVDASTHDAHLDDVAPQFWHRKAGCWRVAIPAPESWQWVYDGRDGKETVYQTLEEVLE